VSAGGIEAVNSGGTAVGAIVASGGFERVSSGGTAERHDRIQRQGAGVFSTAVAVGTVVSSGGEQESSTAVAVGTVVLGAADSGLLQRHGERHDCIRRRLRVRWLLSYGGRYRSSSGGAEFVESNGTASGTVVFGRGVECVSFDGVAIGTVVSAALRDNFLWHGDRHGRFQRRPRSFSRMARSDRWSYEVARGVRSLATTSATTVECSTLEL
jgi:autotransporter passenger strand-loop-strand repeat protein